MREGSMGDILCDTQSHSLARKFRDFIGSSALLPTSLSVHAVEFDATEMDHSGYLGVIRYHSDISELL